MPKYLVHAAYPLFDRANPSFVRKLITMCIIDFICVFFGLCGTNHGPGGLSNTHCPHRKNIETIRMEILWCCLFAIFKTHANHRAEEFWKFYGGTWNNQIRRNIFTHLSGNTVPKDWRCTLWNLVLTVLLGTFLTWNSHMHYDFWSKSLPHGISKIFFVLGSWG